MTLDAWASLPARPLVPYAEALRLAIIERAGPVGEAVPAILSPTLAAGSLPTFAWATAFDTLLTTLIPLYANKDFVVGGDFTGSATIPLWSESEILDFILAEERILAAKGSPILATWAQQAFEILNLLIWTTDAATTFEPRERESGVIPFNADWPTTWADVTTAYLADDWLTVSLDIAGAAGTKVGAAVSGQAVRVRSKARVTPYTGINSSIDWYLFIAAVPGGTVFEFDDEGEGMTFNTFWRYQADDGPAAGTPRTSALPSANEGMTPEPSNPGPGDIIDKGWWATSQRAVIKWDVAGGFAFTD